ncbi:MAG TPA: carbonic anhydrase, partial [Acidimicrobiales bacterium]|nr:carbonic anhydrase [Acidimicrobiales bacterium]
MTIIDELLGHAGQWAASFEPAASTPRPSRKVAVVSCMDSRIDVFAILGLRLNEAHVIRNAGGIVTDDVVRSLVLSQRLLGTEAVLLMHHTDCGMVSTTEEEFAERMEREAGVRPPWTAGF